MLVWTQHPGLTAVPRLRHHLSHTRGKLPYYTMVGCTYSQNYICFLRASYKGLTMSTPVLSSSLCSFYILNIPLFIMLFTSSSCHAPHRRLCVVVTWLSRLVQGQEFPSLELYNKSCALLCFITQHAHITCCSPSLASSRPLVRAPLPSRHASLTHNPRGALRIICRLLSPAAPSSTYSQPVSLPRHPLQRNPSVYLSLLPPSFLSSTYNHLFFLPPFVFISLLFLIFLD